MSLMGHSIYPQEDSTVLLLDVAPVDLTTTIHMEVGHFYCHVLLKINFMALPTSILKLY